MPNGEEEEMSFGVSLWSVGVAAVVLLLPVGSGDEEKRNAGRQERMVRFQGIIMW